jgi:hypothetical protein
MLNLQNIFPFAPGRKKAAAATFHCTFPTSGRKKRGAAAPLFYFRPSRIAS